MAVLQLPSTRLAERFGGATAIATACTALAPIPLAVLLAPRLRRS